MKIVKVPVLPEMTAKVVFDIVKDNPKIMMYLPDPKDGGSKDQQRINREYLFNIVNTVDESFFMKNIANAYKMRKEHEMTKRNNKFEISAFMYNIITSSNSMTVHDKGRALSMLKCGAKKRKRRDI